MHHIMKQIIYRYQNFRVRTKLMLIYVLAGILPILCLGIFLLINTRNLEYEHQLVQLEEENKRVRIIVLNAEYLASRIADNVFYDSSIRDLIGRRYENSEKVYEAYRTNNTLRVFRENYLHFSGIDIYVDNPTMLTSDSYTLINEEIRNEDWYQTLKKSKGEIFWVIRPETRVDGYLVLMRKLPTNDPDLFGILQIRLSHNFLKLMISESDLETKILLDNDEIFFSNDYNEIGTEMDTLSQGTFLINPLIGKINYKDREALAIHSELKTTGKGTQSFSIITMNKDAGENVRELTFLLIVIVSVSFLIPFAFMWVSIRAFSNQIIFLRTQMKKVSAANFTVVEEDIANDELGELYADLKSMIEGIKSLYNEIYAERLMKEKLINQQQSIKFKMLSSQINPHFFFNTLESIRMKAISNGETEVAHIIMLLGRSIRHVLEIKDVFVSLKSELEYIRVYFDIQVFRYGDRIKYDIQIDESIDTEKYCLLPLLIQPVVENALIHGLEAKKSNGLVTVNIQKIDGTIRIAVSDNGVGIDQEHSRVILDKIQGEGRTTGIGLQNIQERIELYYGQEYGIEIDRDVKQGARVTIVLPVEHAVKNHDEIIDR